MIASATGTANVSLPLEEHQWLATRYRRMSPSEHAAIESRRHDKDLSIKHFDLSVAQTAIR